MNDNENPSEDPYICIGICQPDPDSGYCLGCGRPPLGVPDVVVVAETHPPGALPLLSDDSE